MSSTGVGAGSSTGGSAAARSAGKPARLEDAILPVHRLDAPGSVSYPMAGYSWVLLRQHPRRHARELVKLFRWMVTDGQTYAAQLNYIALPPNAQSQALHALDTIK
jgi:ABC-type phosphate transport system substrate-binding protein